MLSPKDFKRIVCIQILSVLKSNISLLILPQRFQKDCLLPMLSPKDFKRIVCIQMLRSKDFKRIVCIQMLRPKDFKSIVCIQILRSKDFRGKQWRSSTLVAGNFLFFFFLIICNGCMIDINTLAFFFSQEKRLGALNKFKSKNSNILQIATDVASRWV